MAKKINGTYYLSRAEAVDYLLFAYPIKWCVSRWSRREVSFSFESKKRKRERVLVNAYFVKDTKNAWVKQAELDYEMCKCTSE